MIFTILKVIGIILLVVLALILTALLCVLFVPVKYKAVVIRSYVQVKAVVAAQAGYVVQQVGKLFQ